MEPPDTLRILAIGNVYPPHDFGGGYEITWRSAMAHLRASGHAVRVLTSDYRAPHLEPAAELDPDVHRELRLYWEDHTFPPRSIRERLAIERANARSLKHHLADFEPDVINWWGLGGLSLSLLEHAKRAGLSSAGVVGDEWMLWGPRADAWLRPLIGRPRRAALARALTSLAAPYRFDGGERWLFNSESVRTKMLASASAFTLDKAEVLHPGIDDDLFGPAPPGPWEWRLLYLGRIDPRKGISTLVNALARLPEQATLVLQGSGDEDYLDELRALSRQLGIESRIEYSRQPREQLPEVYAAADAVIFPVLWQEPWGLVPLEAMAVGRPVVATGTGGSSEYLRHEENCLLYEPIDDPAALAAAIRRLAEDPELRDRLRTGGLATAPRFTESGYNAGIQRALELEARG